MTRLGLSTFLACTLAAAATPLAAQGRHVFDIDTAQSSFTYGGSVTLSGISGNIVGNPNTFSPSGSSDVDLTIGGGTLTTGQFVRGSFVVSIPDLSAIVPNIFPFLPPLATVDVTGVSVVFRSVDPATLNPATFNIAGNGAFATDLTADILSGTATVTALGSTQVVPLAGTQATPQTVTGTIVSTNTGFRLDVPISSVFSFADPGTGASGTLNISGNLRANDRSFASDVDSISASSGGTQTLTLSGGTDHANLLYLMLGSASGTVPGFAVGPVNVPLNADGWLFTVGLGANVAPFGNTAAFLDTLGVNQATITFPPLSPAVVGLVFDHAYLVFDNTTTTIFASNAVRLTLVP